MPGDFTTPNYRAMRRKASLLHVTFGSRLLELKLELSAEHMGMIPFRMCADRLHQIV